MKKRLGSLGVTIFICATSTLGVSAQTLLIPMDSLSTYGIGYDYTDEKGMMDKLRNYINKQTKTAMKDRLQRDLSEEGKKAINNQIEDRVSKEIRNRIQDEVSDNAKKAVDNESTTPSKNNSSSSGYSNNGG